MKLKKPIVILCLVFSLGLQSCATILSGTKDTIMFKSAPDGAKVTVNGVDRGRTPVEITLPRTLWQNSEVVMKKDGYSTKVFRLKRKFNFYTLINLINPFGFLVDIFTGSVTKFSPTYYTVVLEKEK